MRKVGNMYSARTYLKRRIIVFDKIDSLGNGNFRRSALLYIRSGSHSGDLADEAAEETLPTSISRLIF